MKKWYSDGIRFECQGSGKCCLSRGKYGYVYLTLEDRRRFAKFFKIPTAQFTREYCEKTDGYFHIKLEPGLTDCRFVSGKQCSAYEARPTQCRTWPFWPENMSAKAWAREVTSYCPGVGKGKVHTTEEIETVLKQQARSDRELGF